MWDTRTAKLRVSTDSFVRQQEAHAKVRGSCGFVARAEPAAAQELPWVSV